MNVLLLMQGTRILLAGTKAYHMFVYVYVVCVCSLILKLNIKCHSCMLNALAVIIHSIIIIVNFILMSVILRFISTLTILTHPIELPFLLLHLVVDNGNVDGAGVVGGGDEAET